MVVVLKEGATKEEIEEIDKILYKEKPEGGFNTKKYNGIMPFLEDGLVVQNRLRDKWQRILNHFKKKHLITLSIIIVIFE